MKIAFTAALFAMLVFTSGAVRAAERKIELTPRVSWADAKHRHGWVVGGSPRRRYCPRSGNVLCATDDGGKHWRPILRVGDGEIFGYLRWSKTAGVVSVGGKWHFELWTRDGGRHWWGTAAFSPGAYVDLNTGFGAGPRFLLGHGADGRRELRYAYSPQWPYRVRGWIHGRTLRCAGKWTRWSGETIGPKNICGRPEGSDGLSSEPVGPTARLSVSVDSETGDGLVNSSPLGIDCGTLTPWNGQMRHGTACSATYPKGSTVILVARGSANATRQVVRWTGCSRLEGLWCVITVAEDVHATATLNLPRTPVGR